MVVKKTKTKNWYTIIAPKIFDEREIGKTLVSDPEKILGRKIVISAIDLTDNFNKYYLKFSFKISQINGNKALTVFDGSECLRDYISRMILRRVRRVDTVQDLKTNDGIKLRVKALAIISRKAKSSVEETIRKKTEEMTKNFVENSSLEEFIKKILSDEMKNRILQELRKIYPVRNFEFRKTEVK